MTSSSIPGETYFQISHSNNSSFYSTEDIFLYISRLCGTFETLKEISFGNDVNELFQKILPENSSNLLQFNQNLSLKNKPLMTISKLETSMNILLNQSYTNEITLTEQLCSNIVPVLSYCFSKIKNYKIKTHEQFLNAVKESMHYEQDILSDYNKQHEVFMKENKKRNLNLFQLNSSNTSPSDACFQGDNTNSSSLFMKRKDERKRTYDDVTSRNIGYKLHRQSHRSLLSLTRKITLSFEQQIYHYNLISKIKNKASVPDELVILVSKFQCLRKIKFSLSTFEKETSNQKQYLYNMIYILINYEWLFPNLLEIDFDCSNENVYNEVKKEYLNLLTVKQYLNKNTNYDTGFSTQRKFNKPLNESIDDVSNNSGDIIDNEDNDSMNDFYFDISELKDAECLFETKTYQIVERNKNNEKENNTNKKSKNKKNPHFLLNIIENYISMYNALIVYLYFVSIIKQIHVIKMTIPDTFTKDIKIYLAKNKIISPSFYLFNFLFTKANLYELTLDFNCLDSQFFDLLSGFIFQNKSIRNIRLSFFPIDEYFSPEMLYRLLTSPQKEKLRSLLLVKQDNDIDELILEALLPSLEENFNQFFFSLEKTRKLNEVVLLFDLPTLIYNNEKYIMILIKFIINILLLLKYSKFQSKSLNIYAEYLPFNSRKYPFIETFFDDLMLYDRSTCEISKMSFHVQFSSINNIENLIPRSLVYLSIGEFDMETFEEFVLFFTSREYKLISILETIKISLNKSVLQLNETMKLIYDLLISYPKTVKVAAISTWLPLKQNSISEILQKINYNSLECVKLEFGKSDKTGHRLSFSSNFSGGVSHNNMNMSSFVDECFYIQRELKQTNILVNLLMRLGKYYNNKNILQYDILQNIERFIYPKYPKEIIIKTK